LYLLSHCSCVLLAVPSFPTRRSSDLVEVENDLCHRESRTGSKLRAEPFDLEVEIVGRRIDCDSREERRRRVDRAAVEVLAAIEVDRKSTRLNSSHQIISYAVFCLKKK